MKFVTFFTFTLCSLTPLPPTSQFHRTHNFLNSCYTCLLHSMFCFISSYILARPPLAPLAPPGPLWPPRFLRLWYMFTTFNVLFYFTLYIVQCRESCTVCNNLLWAVEIMYVLQPPMYKLKSLEPEWSSLIPSNHYNTRYDTSHCNMILPVWDYLPSNEYIKEVPPNALAWHFQVRCQVWYLPLQCDTTCMRLPS